MRKLIALSTLICLCLSIAACGHEPSLKSHTFQDLTIQIPTDYINLSGEEYAAGLDFVFGLDPIAVNGLREEKAAFEAYGLELDLQTYAKFLLMSNNVSGELAEKDGIHTFSYVSGEFTYVVTLWETEDAFWTVQAYCATEDFPKAEKKMWNILSSVTV